LEDQVRAQKKFATRESPQQTVASKILNPAVLLFVFFSRPKKGHSV